MAKLTLPPENTEAHCEALIAYLERAKKLEIAIVQQKQLIDVYEKYYKDLQPKAPSKQVIQCPQKPEEPTTVNIGCGLFAVAMAFVCGLFIMGLAWGKDNNTFFLTIGAFSLCAGCIGPPIIISSQKENRQQLAKYSVALEQYEASMRKYTEAVDRAEEQYRVEADVYHAEMSRFNDEYNRVVGRQKHLLELLKKALEEHYDADVLLEKYRNLRATGTIAEYIRRARCCTLRGYDGAYALFDLESQKWDPSDYGATKKELERGKAIVRGIEYEIRERITNEWLERYYAEMMALVGKAEQFEIKKEAADAPTETPSC